MSAVARGQPLLVSCLPGALQERTAAGLLPTMYTRCLVREVEVGPAAAAPPGRAQRQAGSPLAPADTLCVQPGLLRLSVQTGRFTQRPQQPTGKSTRILCTPESLRAPSRRLRAFAAPGPAAEARAARRLRVRRRTHAVPFPGPRGHCCNACQRRSRARPRLAGPQKPGHSALHEVAASPSSATGLRCSCSSAPAP